MTNPLLLAKVQKLEHVGICDVMKLQVVRLHQDNPTSIIRLGSFGAVAVIGAHPDETKFGAHHFVVLPWPRQTYVQPDSDHLVD